MQAYASGVPGNFPTCFNPSGMGTQQMTPVASRSARSPAPPATCGIRRRGRVLPVWLGCGTQQPPNWGIDSEADGKINLLAAPGTPSICNPRC